MNHLAAWASALVLASAVVVSARDDKAAETLGFRVGLQAWTFNNLTLFDVVERAHEAGIRYIEMFPGQKLKPGSEVRTGLSMPAEAVAELKEKCKAAGVRIVSFGVSGIPTDEAGARKHFEAAKAFGLEVLVTETTPTPMLDTLAKENGIRIAIHNHPKTWPPDQVLAATKDLSADVGACTDTAHWLRAGFVPADTVEKLKGRIVSMHLKDLNDKNQDTPWGKGRADLLAVLKNLKAQGYKGYMMIEYESDSFENRQKAAIESVAQMDAWAAELSK